MKSDTRLPQLSPKPQVNGPIDGNIFAIIGMARKALAAAGCRAHALELVSRITTEQEAKTYGEALNIVQEYVDLNP